MGIEAVTRADKEYPAALKKKLLGACPPIFYCAGDLELLNNRTVGFVGSRAVEQKDAEFTKNAVNRVVSLGYGVVSGGAKGIDTIAGTEAILRDSFSIEYVSDSMLRKLKSSDTVKRIQDGKLLMLSVVRPDAGFNVGIAMQRNRYIYAQSEATVVVRADLNKGGTWSGATENLRHSWCPTLCWDYPYPGNKALIEKGAVAIVVEKEVEMISGITYIRLHDTRRALATMAAAFFGYPAENLKTIGITGTKGKTTTTYMVRSILEASGIKTGLIGTIETIIGDEKIPAVNTTPESYRRSSAQGLRATERRYSYSTGRSTE